MRTAIYIKCKGEAHSNPRIDHCPECMPFWEDIPTCPDCKVMLTQKGTCKKCRKRFVVRQ